MASCQQCKTRTTTYCFLHTSSICDNCVATPAVLSTTTHKANCPLGNYYDWLVAPDNYQYPPQCTLCKNTVDDSNQPTELVRLVCKCLYHRTCIGQHLQQQLALDSNSNLLRCPNDNSLLVDVTKQRTKLREEVQRLVRQLTKSSTNGTGQQLSTPSQIKSTNASLTTPPKSQAIVHSPSSFTPSPQPEHYTSHNAHRQPAAAVDDDFSIFPSLADSLPTPSSAAYTTTQAKQRFKFPAAASNDHALNIDDTDNDDSTGKTALKPQHRTSQRRIIIVGCIILLVCVVYWYNQPLSSAVKVQTQHLKETVGRIRTGSRQRGAG